MRWVRMTFMFSMDVPRLCRSLHGACLVQFLGTPSPSPQSPSGLPCGSPANAPRRCSDAYTHTGGWKGSSLLMVVLNSLTSPFFQHVIVCLVCLVWGCGDRMKSSCFTSVSVLSCSCYWCFLSLIRSFRTVFFFFEMESSHSFKIMYVNCSVVSDFVTPWTCVAC